MISHSDKKHEEKKQPVKLSFIMAMLLIVLLIMSPMVLNIQSFGKIKDLYKILENILFTLRQQSIFIVVTITIVLGSIITFLIIEQINRKREIQSIRSELYQLNNSLNELRSELTGSTSNLNLLGKAFLLIKEYEQFPLKINKKFAIEMLRSIVSLIVKNQDMNYIGIPGQMVNYDPSIHETYEDIKKGDEVWITVPGWKDTSDHILIPALTSPNPPTWMKTSTQKKRRKK